ncbi:MAG TPA: hypothetical protein VHW65_02650 [Gemmatimonadales bacterium]|jgi:hypothetical protein|nr:hypothetical protein [Gemmatimonadales bacterium]
MLAMFLAACSSSDSNTAPPPTVPPVVSLRAVSASTVTECLSLPVNLYVQVLDTLNRPVVGALVSWSVVTGHGAVVSSASGKTDGLGYNTGTYLVGTAVEGATVTATVVGAPAAVTYSVQSVSPCPVRGVVTAGGGQVADVGVTLPTLLQLQVLNDSGPVIGRAVTWNVVSGGGSVVPLGASSDSSGNAFARFTLGSSGTTQSVQAVITGVSTPVVFGETALDPAATPVLVANVPAPAGATYDHDSFVRDGLAFVCDWNMGVRIYDVGNGMASGSPAHPQLISSLITSDDGVPGGPAVHNAWWFHNPVSGENRYLFIGQEGPAVVGSTSSGDIHIVDVSNLAHPVETGFIHIPGAGTHNFWMDEANQILYAAYYNGGVIAVDVSGELSGDMSSRIRTEVMPGGSGNTYVWGVMLANGTLYAADMLSGLWALNPGSLATKGGGNNVPARYTSDLWVDGQYAYTGGWGARAVAGNIINIWSLGANGAPALADSILIPGITTVSDIAVSDDHKRLVATAEGGAGAGLYVFDLVDPAHPVLRGRVLVPQGLHTGELATINGRSYVFAAVDPSAQGMNIYDITNVVQ